MMAAAKNRQVEKAVAQNSMQLFDDNSMITTSYLTCYCNDNGKKRRSQ